MAVQERRKLFGASDLSKCECLASMQVPGDVEQRGSPESCMSSCGRTIA